MTHGDAGLSLRAAGASQLCSADPLNPINGGPRKLSRVGNGTLEAKG